MKPLALLLALPLLLPATLRAESDVNTAAAFLAGVPADDRSQASLFASSAWRQHAANLNSVWGRYEQQTLNPMLQWSRAELAPQTTGLTTVRYLFSGPDILHALHVFPDATTYIMGGLEPIGNPPSLDGLSIPQANQALAETRKALEDIIRFSFFITKDMKVDLKDATFPGTLPLITLFLARTGHHIDTITYSKLQKDGTLARTDAANANAVSVRFTHASRRGGQKTLHYFSTNVADGSVTSSGFLNYLKAQPPGAAYLKAASYLLHESYFSTVRDHLLTHSQTIVQDDSGIPLKHFSPQSWSIALYGKYTTPIELFANRQQSDLFAAYQRGPVRPLPFGTGYRWRQDDSNLMVATRATRPTPAPPVVARTPEPAVPRAIPVVRPDVPPNTYPPAPDGRVTLSLRLARTSTPPASAPGGRALVVFEYDVLAVESGRYPHPKIRVAHGAVWGGTPTTISRRPVGWTTSLELVPLSRYAALDNIPTSDDLPPSRDLPLYTPALD